MPYWCAIVIISILIIGIIIGSFCDYKISLALAHSSHIGTLLEDYGGFVSFCLYPAAGMCIYKGLKKKGKKWNKISWGILVLSYFIGLFYCNSHFGDSLFYFFNYKPGETDPLRSMCCYLAMILLLSWVIPVMNIILDDKNPNLLIAIGTIIIVAGITSDLLNELLKEVASRPRISYLLTLDNPEEHFRNWWQMVPGLEIFKEEFTSWPSGHMADAAMLLSLPLLAYVLKNKKKYVRWILFTIACLWIILTGYNRIHMTDHFLTDVCFGILFTYIVYLITYWIIMPSDSK